MTLNLSVLLAERAETKPNKVALVLGDRQVTFAGLVWEAKTFANGLACLGVKPGDKVAMEGGWFHAGDAATIDEGGFVFVVDRVKHMIVRGSYNVYPREVLLPARTWS